MPNMTVKGLKGLSAAMQELAKIVGEDISEESINYYGQQTKDRLEQDTPVVTGRLKRSTVFRLDNPTHGVVGQFAPYANVVNNRRGYWQGAISVSQEWPQYYSRLLGERIGLLSRKYGGK